MGAGGVWLDCRVEESGDGVDAGFALAWVEGGGGAEDFAGDVGVVVWVGGGMLWDVG